MTYQRLRPHQIEPEGDDGDIATIVAGRVTFAPGGGINGITIQDENGTVATDVTQIDLQGDLVVASSGTGEVIITVNPPAASALTTMLVPLVTTNPSGDPDFVWSAEGELIWMEVPL